jgi:hypothetical protein
MALRLAKFALVLGMVLAMAVVIRTITTGLSPLKFAERVDSANGAGVTDLSASTLEFVLKVQ